MNTPKPTDSEQLEHSDYFDHELKIVISNEYGYLTPDDKFTRIKKLVEERDKERLSTVLEAVGRDEIVLDDDDIAEYHPRARAHERAENEANAVRNEFRAVLRPALTAALGPDNSKTKE